MAFVIGFDLVPKRASYPHDPADLRRCMKLLAVAPSIRHNLEKMTKVCPVWAEIVKRWNELESTYKEECDQNKMPKTYALLQQCAQKDKRRIVIGNGVSIRFS